MHFGNYVFYDVNAYVDKYGCICFQIPIYNNLYLEILKIRFLYSKHQTVIVVSFIWTCFGIVLTTKLDTLYPNLVFPEYP